MCTEFILGVAAIVKHFHTERNGTLCDFLADSAESDKAERVTFCARGHDSLPFALVHALALQVDSPCKIENICHNAFCNRALNRAESTGNCYAVLFAEINVYRIVADSAAGDNFEIFAFFYCLVADFFGTAYNCVGIKHE